MPFERSPNQAPQRFEMLQGIACALGGNLFVLVGSIALTVWASGLSDLLDCLRIFSVLWLLLQWMMVIPICVSWWEEYREFSIGVLLGAMLSTVGQTGCLGTLALPALMVRTAPELVGGDGGPGVVASL